MSGLLGHRGLLSVSVGPPLTVVTWNPADKSADTLLSESNLRATHSGANAFGTVRATEFIVGKKYFEVLVGSSVSAYIVIGVLAAAGTLTTYVGADTHGWGYYQETGNKFHNTVSTAYGAAYTSGDVIGVAYDSDTGTIEFFKNNASQGVAFTGISIPVKPAVSLWRSDAPAHTVRGRFKASEFSYAPPAGYSPMGI